MGFEVEGDDTTPSPLADDESNLRLNLPYKVVFPSNASDVLQIVLFAMKNKIELSSVSRTAVIVIQVHQAREILSS